MNPADHLLLAYAEIRSVLSGGQAQNLVAFTGHKTSLHCADPGCGGFPRKRLDGWKCSACGKKWPLEEVDVFKNEFHDGHKAFGRRDLRVRMVDFALVLERVRKKEPWPFAAWTTHVLGSPAPEEDEAERHRRGLGLPMDLVAERLLLMRDAGEIDAPPMVGISFDRVRWWIGTARKCVLAEIPFGGL
jgi:hypothetical protein